MLEKSRATRPSTCAESPNSERNASLSYRKTQTALNRGSRVGVLSQWQLMLLGISITHQSPSAATPTDLRTVKTILAKRRGSSSRPVLEDHPTSENMYISLHRGASGALTEGSTTATAEASDDFSDAHGSALPTIKSSWTVVQSQSASHRTTATRPNGT